MKKILVVSLVLLMGAGAVFAQQAAPAKEQAAAPKEKKNAISLDMFQLFKGFIASDSDAKTFFFNASLNYERLVASHFSIGAQLDLAPGKVWNIDCFYLGMSAFGRYYPMSTDFDKFFLGTSLGINRLSIDGKAEAERGGFFGFTTSLITGYRVVFANVVYLEPSMAYVLSKSGGGIDLMGISMSYPSVVPLGWQGGLRFGIVF